MRWLARYLSELTFYRPGDQWAPPQAFAVPYDRIHVEPPDADVVLEFPSIAILGDEQEQYERGPVFVGGRSRHICCQYEQVIRQCHKLVE